MQLNKLYSVSRGFLLSKIWQTLNLNARGRAPLVPRTIYAPVLLESVCERHSQCVYINIYLYIHTHTCTQNV